MAGSSWSRPSGRRLGVAAAVVALLVVVVGLLALRGPDEDDSSPAADVGASPSTPTSETTAPTDGSPPPDASASAVPSDTATDTTGSTGPAPGAANTQPARAVGLGETAEAAPGLEVDVARIESIRSQAETPGETSRPSLRITVRISNSGSQPVEVDGALTNLYYGPDRTPANTSDRPGGRPFPAEVPAGGAVTGVYVFNVPVAERDQLALEVSVDAQLRRLEFRGSA